MTTTAPEDPPELVAAARAAIRYAGEVGDGLDDLEAWYDRLCDRANELALRGPELLRWLAAHPEWAASGKGPDSVPIDGGYLAVVEAMLVEDLLRIAAEQPEYPTAEPEPARVRLALDAEELELVRVACFDRRAALARKRSNTRPGTSRDDARKAGRLDGQIACYDRIAQRIAEAVPS